ncbi:hypothetical protein [Streptomyces sp. NPDC048581]|uniref:hypothetical protein n=1 Tax=unclassified Streptomyces TaxID=2593676 RepID=UPI003720E7F1
MATLGPDGAPQNSPAELGGLDQARRGHCALLLRRHPPESAQPPPRPRVSISVYDLANPYNSVEIRGTAEILPDEAKRLPSELSHKYLGIDPPAEKDDETRVIIRVVRGRSCASRPDRRRPPVAVTARLRVHAPDGTARMKGAGTSGASRAAPAVRHREVLQ